MLGAPITLNPKAKLNWRDKIKRRSFQLPKAEYREFRTPDKVPSLSSSRGLTPASRRSRGLTPRLKQEDVFLTALDVLDAQSINDYDLLIDSQVLNRGSLTIPPPPPKNKAEEHSVGPKIRPFFASSVAVEPRALCFICHELLETRLETEKLVPLLCGDCVHSECLHISATFSLERALSEGTISVRSSEAAVEKAVLPLCEGTKCQHEKRRSAVAPLEEAFTDELLSEAMLTVKLTNVPVVSRNATPETPTPRHFPFRSQPDKNPANQNPDSSAVQNLDNPANQNLDYPAIQNPDKNPPSNRIFQTDQDKNYQSTRKNQGGLHPYSVSNSLVYANRVSQFYTKENFELKIKHAAKPPQSQSFLRKSFPPDSVLSVEEMRNLAIKHMLRAYDFDLGILTSLGSLKLTDRLFVSLNDLDFAPQIVYLFTDFLVVGHGETPVLFPLKTKFSLSTPDTAVLCFESSDNEVPRLKLHSEVSSTMEKWGIAVSDTLLLIPAELVTSLSIQELKEATEHGRNEKHAGGKSRLVCNLTVLDSNFYSAFYRDSVANIRDGNVDDFEQQLISYGLVPALKLESLVENEESETEISPLHIVRRTLSDIPVLLSYLDLETEVSSSDEDSDSDLISKIKHKYLDRHH